MSLRRQIGRNTIVQIAGKIVSTVLGLAAVMLMTRGLGAEKFGWYITATSFLQFIGLLSDFGFTVAASSMLAEPRFDKKQLLDTIFTWRLLTALLFYLPAPLIILLFPYAPQIKIAVAVITVAYICIALNQVFAAYYQVGLKMRIYTVAELLGRIILVVGIYLIFQTNRGFLPAMLVITAAALSNTAYLWLKSEGVRLSFHKEISAAFFRKLWPVAVAVIFNAFYLQGDRVILPLYASQTEVGLYGSAWRVIEILIQLIAIIMGLMLPLLAYSWSRADRQNFQKRAQWSFDIVFAVLLPMLAGGVLLAKPIMMFVGGSGFAAAGGLLALLMLALAGVCFGMIFGHIILAVNRQKEAIFIYASCALFSVMAFLIFIPRYGAYGAAWISALAELYAGALLTIVAIYYSKFFPALTNLLKTTLAAGMMALTLYALQPLNLLFSLALGAVIYGALILSLGVLKMETLREIASVKTETKTD